MGRTTGEGLARPWLRRTGDAGVGVGEGAISADGRVFGAYVHRLFDSGPARAELLAAWARPRPPWIIGFRSIWRWTRSPPCWKPIWMSRPWRVSPG